MKKFCSECGHPLEISKKFCSDCGTNNPYFSIGHEAPSGRSSAIDELRARKESIEKELEEIEREQAEVQHKEKLRREMEELERQRTARQEKEKEIKERFEREDIEASFKKEILQVKEETELYKKQTHELLTELRDVIVQIDEENKRLKEEVQQIAKAKPVEQEVFFQPAPSITEDNNQIPTADSEAAKAGSEKLISLALLLFVAVSVGLAVYLYSTGKPADGGNENVAETPAVTNQTATTPAAAQSAVTEAELPVVETPVTATEPVPAKVESKPVSKAFTLSVSKAKADLIGKSLAGCGITLASTAEIDRISQPVLIENSAALGYVKYKLDMNVKQEGELYHVMPYVYYTPEGKFMRVDASNCE